MLTLSTDSLKGYGINRIFELAKEAGLDGLDIAVDPKNYDTLNSAYLKKLSSEHGLPIVALQAAPNASHSQILETVETAKTMGVNIIIVQPPRITNIRQTQWLKSQIPKIRKRENLSIALENASPETYLGFIPKRAMTSLVELRRFKHACIDTSRLAEKKEDIIRVYGLLKDYIVHIHLSNVFRRQSYALPMKGVLPLESFLTKLKAENYNGAVSLKIQPRFLEAGNDEKVVKNLKECKKFFEEFFK